MDQAAYTLRRAHRGTTGLQETHAPDILLVWRILTHPPFQRSLWSSCFTPFLPAGEGRVSKTCLDLPALVEDEIRSAKIIAASRTEHCQWSSEDSRRVGSRALNTRKQQHVPLHRGPEKNWDHLAAVSTILAHTKPNARILDAGAEIYSNVLPALFLYGYHDLYGINLSFTAPTRRGPIRYIPGDLTRTPYEDGFFDAIACMSVIEHGVPLRRLLPRDVSPAEAGRPADHLDRLLPHCRSIRADRSRTACRSRSSPAGD